MDQSRATFSLGSTISIVSAGRAVRNFRFSVNRQSEPSFLAWLFVLYSTIGVMYLVVPIASRFGGVLLGSSLIPQDVFLTSGTMEWGFRSLFSSSRRLFDWNAGFPLRNSLAVSENLVGWQVLYYPLRALGVGVPAAYNTVLLLSLVLSGIGAALLARRFGANRWGAAAAGIVFGYGPFHLNNLMHIQTMAVCWTPFALLFLDRFMERSNLRDAIGVGASYALTALSSVYFGAFLALILPMYVLLAGIFGRYKLTRNMIGRLALVALITLAAVSPIAIPYIRFAREHGQYGLSAKGMAELSMEWLTPARTPSFQLAWEKTPLRWKNPWDGQPAFLGIVGLSLVAVGVSEFRRGRSERAAVLTVVALSLFSYLLALGPYFKTAGSGPSRIIEWVPMPGRLWLLTPGIRNPARFFFFAWLGGSILAGLGLSAIARKIHPPVRTVLAACVLVMLVVEYWPASWLAGESVKAAAPLLMSDAYPFLASEPDSGGVIEFPTADWSGARLDFGRYIYGASGHLRGVVALHGNHRIPLIDSLRAAGESLPGDSARVFLASHRVTRVVVHRFIGDSARNARLIAALGGARFPLVFNGRESAVFAIPRANHD